MLDIAHSASSLRTHVSLSSASSPKPHLVAREVKSHALFDGAQEVRIDHHGQEYRLRQTRNGKLILTK
jgi:hemin uptake protein HemP